MIGRTSLKDAERGEQELRAAVGAFRTGAAGRDSLSGAARTRILEAAMAPAGNPVSPASLFVPARRLVMAGTLPVVLGAALALLLGRAGSYPGPTGPQVVVAKRDGHVVFTLANGGRHHTICRSTVPDRFDCDRGVPVKGAYAEPVDSGSTITYYRID